MNASGGTGAVRALAIVFVVGGAPTIYAGYQLAEKINAFLLYFLMFLVLSSVAVANHGELLRRRAHALFCGLFVVLFVASLLTVLREGGTASYNQIVLLATCFIWSSAFLVVFFLVRTPAHVRLSIWTLDAFGIVISLSVYLAYVLPRTIGLEFGESVAIYGENRAFGPLGDNVGFVVVLFVLRSMTSGRWFQLPYHMGAVLITGTRGALATLLVGAAWLTLVTLRGRWRRVGFALLCGALVILGFLSSPLGEAARSRLLETSATTGSGLHRLDAMALGIRVWLDNPLLGVGFLGFSRAIDRYDISEYFGPGGDIARGTFSTQNQYIQTATDGGIFGLAMLVLLLWVLLANLRQARTSAEADLRSALIGYEAWLVGVLVGNQAMVWLLPSAATGYFVFLVAGLTERIADLQERAAARRFAPAVAGPPRFRGGAS